MEVTIIDSTLRDGSHAVMQQLSAHDIKAYAKGAEAAGISILMVGHGNGLGASSLQLGMSLLTDHQMLKAAKSQLKKTKLGAFLTPGFGTIERDLNPALADGVEVMMVASHCTEANLTREHIEYLVRKKVTTYGVLMMAHMATAEKLLEQARLMEGYGARGVLLMDTAGSLLPDLVTQRVGLLSKNLKIDVGFHSHNNLGMAIANSISAVSAGAKIIDGTTRGLGAGAGNCQLEVFGAVCEKLGIKVNIDLFALMDLSENVVTKIRTSPQDITAVSLVSGMEGLSSGFAPHAKRAANKFSVDVKNILQELGRRNVVVGQEDIIIDVAYNLKRRKRKPNTEPIEALL